MATSAVIAVLVHHSAHDRWNWSLTAEFLTAFGTIGAVAVALYLSRWREWRRTPSLSLEFDPAHAGDLMAIGFIANWIGPAAAWVRFRVGNRPKRRTADDVEVLVLRVLFKPIGGEWRTLQIGNLPLPWSNSSPTTTRLDLASGVERHVDVISVSKSQTPIDAEANAEESAVPSTTAALSEQGVEAFLTIHVQPGGETLVYGGKFQIELAVTARHVDAVYYTFDWSFDGRWSDDEKRLLSEHLVLGSLRSGRLTDLSSA